MHLAEYKTIEVEGEDNGDYYPMHIPVSDTLLNRMGAEGWESAAGYPIVSTTYADLGNKRIIIQLKSNARTSAVRYVFKKRNF